MAKTLNELVTLENYLVRTVFLVDHPHSILERSWLR